MRVGTSGWAYAWGNFYPHAIPKRDLLAFYSRRFDTVEVNNTFYHLPRESAYERWLEETPDGFVFTLKLSRFITHVKRLSGVRDGLRVFLRGARLLGPKLGPVLVQLPPSQRADARRLASFLTSARIAARDVIGRDLRLAFEFRHASWFTSERSLELLSEHDAALVLANSTRYPAPEGEPRTASWAYVRFHGPRELFASRYGAAGLRPWAQSIRSWLVRGDDVYAYFNNDAGGHAPVDARTLRRLAAA